MGVVTSGPPGIAALNCSLGAERCDGGAPLADAPAAAASGAAGATAASAVATAEGERGPSECPVAGVAIAVPAMGVTPLPGTDAVGVSAPDASAAAIPICGLDPADDGTACPSTADVEGAGESFGVEAGVFSGRSLVVSSTPDAFTDCECVSTLVLLARWLLCSDIACFFALWWITLLNCSKLWVAKNLSTQSDTSCSMLSRCS
mmetsp:Transcript_6283/g.17117  ORF Transcript_6283/g.17117 Transcript_6283/m.17117 type:complete len:204 (-) Transcript_6283:747-1358(-)